jgi:hypothetical protein
MKMVEGAVANPLLKVLLCRANPGSAHVHNAMLLFCFRLDIAVELLDKVVYADDSTVLVRAPEQIHWHCPYLRLRCIQARVFQPWSWFEKQGQCNGLVFITRL